MRTFKIQTPAIAVNADDTAEQIVKMAISALKSVDQYGDVEYLEARFSGSNLDLNEVKEVLNGRFVRFV